MEWFLLVLMHYANGNTGKWSWKMPDLETCERAAQTAAYHGQATGDDQAGISVVCVNAPHGNIVERTNG